MDEEIVLLNENGIPVGRAPKLQSHSYKTPLHLGFSCYIFNKDGQFLLTKRADTKKVWPGVWSNSVCGHPAPGESITGAIKRRCLFELGLDDIREIEVILPEYRYKTPLFNGIMENEICPVYTATTHKNPKLNLTEVSEYKWLGWNEVLDDVKAKPEQYTYWFKDQIPKIKVGS